MKFDITTPKFSEKGQSNNNTTQADRYSEAMGKIKEIRERLTKQLGAKFKLSDFHDELLKDGNMPLEVLEKKMDQWANGLK
jgi:uncharacterized protein (DUF885 family)